MKIRHKLYPGPVLPPTSWPSPILCPISLFRPKRQSYASIFERKSVVLHYRKGPEKTQKKHTLPLCCKMTRLNTKMQSVTLPTAVLYLEI